MSLPTRQQRLLDVIDSRLCQSEPRLAAMFATFGRLCGHDPPPRREQLSVETTVRRILYARLPILSTEHGRTNVRRVLVLAQLTIVIVLVAVLIGLNAHGDGAKCDSQNNSGAGRVAAAVAHEPACPGQVSTQSVMQK